LLATDWTENSEDTTLFDKTEGTIVLNKIEYESNIVEFIKALLEVE
jgi:hypothetical protein